MDESTIQDPLDWDVDTVARELAASKRPLTHDAASLAARVKEEEIDGETLLTFEFLCSRQELMECLGIKLARHKAAFAATILNLRSRSKQYYLWKQNFERQQTSFQEDSQPIPKAVVDDASPLQSADVSRQPLLPSPPPQSTTNDVQTSTSNNEVGTTVSTEPPVTSSEQSSIPLSKTDSEPPKKRQRVATLIPVERPVDIHSAFLSEEDQHRNAHPSASSQNPQTNDQTREPIVTPPNPFDASSLILEFDDDSFATILSNRISPHQRYAAFRKMRKLLFRPDAETTKRSLQSGSSDSDEIIDLSGPLEEFDEETLREMEEEGDDDENRDDEGQRRDRYLPREEVDTILDAAMAIMKSDWEARKLIRLQRKAYTQWREAHRRGTATQQVLKSRQRAQVLGERIQKLRTHITDIKWQKESDVQSQARSLEQSVEDRLSETWYAEMLGSRTAPPKPESVPRTCVPRPVIREQDDLDEELLTSSGEDDFEDHEAEIELGRDIMDFIDDSLAANMDIDSTRIKEEFPPLIDLTQVQVPETPSRKGKSKVLIDLTTPVTTPVRPTRISNADRPHAPERSSVLSSPGERPPPEPIPDISTFEDVQTICDAGFKPWTRANDRWRLAIAIIGKLRHDRRRALLDFILEENKSYADAWIESVDAHLKDPLQDPSEVEPPDAGLVALDMTRLFLSFANCKVVKERKICAPTPDLKTKLQKARGPWFKVLLTFVKGIASLFPQDSQIYREEILNGLLDEDADEGETFDDEESQAIIRALPREIIQSKEAIDIRERERLRIEEQEMRRQLLRKELQGRMNQTQTRLIINETKREDEPFLYINEDIAHRILDHQVEGVRFLWNNVVQSKQETAPGCLLAHTMGLGKTMQVITLLVAVSEAASSQDPAVRALIPESVRESRTLVLCPAALVENWMDELLLWAPEGLLGKLYKIQSVTSPEARIHDVRAWASEGGVLLIGYPMFKILMTGEEVSDLLANKPNIVVADEAHEMKNPGSQTNQMCATFRTPHRIALTGSPLANNVEEYFSMIQWVAPMFLGGLKEFSRIYSKPIMDGLWKTSLPIQKRHALKMLAVLKRTVTPKVDRRTMSVIKHKLPEKFEFVLYLRPTEVQQIMYQTYLDGIQESNSPSTRHFLSVMSQLGLLCNHPRCFEHSLAKQQKENVENNPFPTYLIPQTLEQLRTYDLASPELSWKTQLLLIILDEARKIGDKVLVFSHSIPTLDFLGRLFKAQHRKYFLLQGDVPAQKRLDMIKIFNSGDREVFLISTKAGSVGLNIQGANRVVLFDYKFSPAHEMQAVGRAYRIGQQKKTYVYRFVVAGSLEDQLQQRQVFKMQLASRVVDHQNPASWAERSQFLQPLKELPAEDLHPFLGKDDILDMLIRHKAGGEIIRKIVPADTFEEEDERPDNKLSANEEKELETIVTSDMNPVQMGLAVSGRGQDPYAQVYSLGQQLVSGISAMIPGLSSTQPPPAPTGHSNSLVPPPESPNPGQQPQNSSGTPATFDRSRISASQPTTPAETNMNQQPPGLPMPLPAAPSAPPAPPPQQTFGPAPQPFPGANTFFRRHSAGNVTNPNQAPSSSSNSLPKPTIPDLSSKVGSIFGDPGNQAKNNFEKSLENRVRELQRHESRFTDGEPNIIARTFTEKVDQALDPSAGFLPNNKRWHFLEQMLTHDRFALAMISGFISPAYVANIPEEDLANRVESINGLSEDDFSNQAGRAVNQADPDNLANIGRRTTTTGPHKSRVDEDMMIMREAAENRLRRRGFRLPTWASRALTEESGRSLPAAHTVQTIEDRRSRSRNGAPEHTEERARG